jgi:C4-type Zn-finger protein
MKERCPVCKRKFSIHLLSPLVTNEGRQLMCPICALKIINTIHGLPLDTPFRGEMAQEMYEEALEELKGEERRKI